MRAVLIIAALMAALVVCSAQDANIILRKRMHTEYQGVMAVGHNFTVELTVFNVGKRDAINVTVRENWGAEHFELREGDLIHTWPTVSAGSQVSHNVTLAPKQDGEIGGFRAIVQYKTSADGPLQVGFSTPMVPHVIFPSDRYEKLTAKHYIEWAIYSIGTGGLVLLPLYLWWAAAKVSKKAA
jgi:hypothetical protein